MTPVKPTPGAADATSARSPGEADDLIACLRKMAQMNADTYDGSPKDDAADPTSYTTWRASDLIEDLRRACEEALRIVQHYGEHGRGCGIRPGHPEDEPLITAIAALVERETERCEAQINDLRLEGASCSWNDALNAAVSAIRERGKPA